MVDFVPNKCKIESYGLPNIANLPAVEISFVVGLLLVSGGTVCGSMERLVGGFSFSNM